MNARRTITLLILILLGSFAACASAPQGVVDVGNPPDTSTITPQKATLMGLEIGCAPENTLTVGELDATCIGDGEYSWSAVASALTPDEMSAGTAPVDIAKQMLLEEFPQISPDLIITGSLDGTWFFARLDRREEVITVYASATARVELSVSFADADDRGDISVAPRPEPRPVDSPRPSAPSRRDRPSS